MFVMEEEKNTKTKADIRVIGVGGGGCNALETMIKEGIQGVKFIAVNTDHQALDNSSAKAKVQLGNKLTKGLGAGANPETGRRAAVESYEEIVKNLQGADMVFVTAGMGGGTGTGGAPIVAQAADELNILTVGIVTKPFVFEGRKRTQQAEQGISEMRNYVDTLIVIPNEKLLDVSDENTPLLDTFKITDSVLLQAVKGIAELVSVPGLINLDFADIKTVMMNKGMALMGRGVAEGEGRAKKAICSAISSPLLEGVSIKGATGMIVNITADPSLSLTEVKSASSVLTQFAEDSADVIVGTVIDKNMGNKLSVTVIATGFKNEKTAHSDSPILSIEKENAEPASSLFSKSSMEFQKTDTPEEEIHSPIEEPKEAGSVEPALPPMEEPTETAPMEESQELSPVEAGSPMDSANTPMEEAQEASLVVNETAEQDSETASPDREEEKEPDSPAHRVDNSQPSPKEILLSKVKEYENKEQQKENPPSENQISMDWKESQLEEDFSSPFESPVDFSEEDML